MRQGDRDRVGEGGRRGGGGLVGLVGKGNRQPVYYQGSIEKHLGTNRTPPPCHPVPFSPCQPRPFSQTPGGSGRGDRGEEAGSGWWGVLKMEYPVAANCCTAPLWMEKECRSVQHQATQCMAIVYSLEESRKLGKNQKQRLASLLYYTQHTAATSTQTPNQQPQREKERGKGKEREKGKKEESKGGEGQQREMEERRKRDRSSVGGDAEMRMLRGGPALRNCAQRSVWPSRKLLKAGRRPA
ncbi:hypothetical protein NQZ68_029163 [Dissostichus eleginoides]|nr:hypothetical protein NQZ68_029163 [Dissostichus eleginoides]